MTYLFLKEISERDNDEGFMIVSSMLKDLASENELFRSNSLRVLSRILNVGFLCFGHCYSFLVHV